MRTRNLVIAGAVVVIAAGAGWMLFGAGSGGAKVTAGAGQYQTQLVDCQDRIHGDEMHMPELEFTPNTVWHETSPSVKLGGKYTKPGPQGRKMSYAYECTFQGARIIATNVR